MNLEAIGLANVDPLKTSLHTHSRSAHIHAVLPESIQTVDQRDRLLRKIWRLPNWRSSRITDSSFFVPTLPPILSFGETEQSAQQKYGDSLIIIRSPYHRLAAAKLTEQESGLCKLIAHPNGRLLGLHWYGAGAEEAQGWLAQLWQQSPSLETIAQLPLNDGSFAAILSQAAQDWKIHRARQSTWQNGLRETYFNALRDWLS